MGMLTGCPHLLPEQQLHYAPDINSTVLLMTGNQTTPQNLSEYESGSRHDTWVG